MSRTRRVYTDPGDQANFPFFGDLWSTNSTPNMSSGYTTLAYPITMGSGKTAKTFSEITIWIDGVISLGPPTAGQISFMSQFQGSQNISQFPGYYISAGYTDVGAASASNGTYEVTISTGQVAFDPESDGSYHLSDAVPVTKITWEPVGGDFTTIKQMLLAPSFFMIGNTQYDGQGAGFGLGEVAVNGATAQIPGSSNYQGDYFAKVQTDIYGVSQSSVVIENTSGGVDIGQAASGQIGYQRVVNLPAGSTVVGVGDFLALGQAQFLVENADGSVNIGLVPALNKIATMTPFTSLGSWKVVGTGDFLGVGHDQFLIENASGALYFGQLGPSGTAVYHSFAALGSTWKVVGSGDFLAVGSDQFLVENASGTLEIGQAGAGEQATLHSFAALGAWKVVGTGDFLSEGHDQFLIENASGALYTAQDGPGEAATYHSFSSVASGWTLVATGDFLGEGHDQFLLESGAGQLMIGDYTGGAVHYTTQTNEIGLVWTFHG